MHRHLALPVHTECVRIDQLHGVFRVLVCHLFRRRPSLDAVQKTRHGAAHQSQHFVAHLFLRRLWLFGSVSGVRKAERDGNQRFDHTDWHSGLLYDNQVEKQAGNLPKTER